MLVFLFVLSLIHNSKQWDNTLQSVYDKVFLDKLQNVPDTIPLCLPDNTTVRTFENHTTHMFVEVFVELYQLISVDEREQTIDLNLGVILKWFDCRLMWNRSESLMLEQIRTSVNRKDGVRIFIPEIQLIEGRSDVNFEFDEDTDLIIFHNGSVTMEKTLTRDILCDINVAMYPFDAQTCTLSLMSAYYPIDCLNITSKQTRHQFVNAYSASDTWDLVHVSRSWKLFNAMNEKYSAMVYTIKWRRRPTYELVNLLLPAMLTALISSFIFFTPSGTIDKIGLNLTILLSLFVFTQIMYGKMPETGSTLPLLSQYFMICIGLVTLSCTFSVVSVNVASCRSKTMPFLLQKLAMLLGPTCAPGIYKKLKMAIEKRQKNLSDAIGTMCSQPEGEDNSVETSRWQLLATLFDRAFFVVHILTTLGTLAFYLINGFLYWYEEQDDVDDS